MSTTRRIVNVICLVALLVLSASALWPQPAPRSSEAARVTALERKVDSLSHHGDEAAGGCGLGFLFGAFCALWAQNTGRSPWLWFFLGLFFSVITVIVLLSKNASDLATRRAGVGPPA